MTAEYTMARWRKQKPYMLTQDELLSELAALGADVTPRQLRDWTYEARVLPHPVNRKPPGATTGGARAMYPGVTIYLAFDVAQGMSIADARATLDARTTEYQRYFKSIEEQLGLVSFTLVKDQYPGWPPIPIALRRESLEYADRVGKHLGESGEEAVQVTLRIYVVTAKRRFHTDITVETPKVAKKRGGKH